VGRHEGVRTEQYKLINFYTDSIYEMYDLHADPHEVKNLYGNPEYATIQKELKEKLADLRTQYEVPEEHFSAPFPVN